MSTARQSGKEVALRRAEMREVRLQCEGNYTMIIVTHSRISKNRTDRQAVGRLSSRHLPNKIGLHRFRRDLGDGNKN